jgi:hypothetical protein
MKTTEEYLDDYFDKQNELERKGERWRLRVTPEEFIKEIASIRNYGIETRKQNILTENHIQRNEEAMVSIMLMDRATLEEMREQCNRLKKEGEKSFAEQAPAIQMELKHIQTPLAFNDIANIYTWLWRKQITIEMLSEKVAEEFKRTEHYEEIIRRNKEESI